MTAKTNTGVRRRALLAMAVLTAGLGLGSGALADPGGGVDLKVVDRATGRVLPFWRRGGRLFVAGDPGRRYGLRVTNGTGGRVMLVLSVDGVNVLTGETGGYDQNGYVLDPYESYDVNGWRKSRSQIAAFTFAPQSRSYAARTGRPGDVGVIGMAVFSERVAEVEDDARPARARGRADELSVDRALKPAPPPLALPPVPAPAPPARAAPSAGSSRMADARTSAPSVSASIAPRTDEKLGTGHGRRERSSIDYTDFERATSRPESLRLIEYDTASNLLAQGVTPPRLFEHRPRPFPVEHGAGFVPDPPIDR